MPETVQKVLEYILGYLAGVNWSSSAVNILKLLNCQRRRRGSVELCNFVEHLDCLSFFALADKKFRGLVEVENKKAQEKDSQGHAA